MSQLLKLQIVNGKARQRPIDPAVDSFTFKEITIGSVTLTEETVGGLSKDALDTLEAALTDRLDTAEGRLDDLEDRATNAEGRLDTAETSLSAILANNPDQWTEKVAVSSKSDFTVSGFSFDVSHTVLDIEVYVNGLRLVQCTAGDFSTGSFRKTSDTSFELSEAAHENAEVTVWRQGTSSAGSGSGSGGADVDLTAITQNPAPSLAGGQSLGTEAKAWSGLYLKDTVTSQAYLVRIVNGVFEAVEVPE